MAAVIVDRFNGMNSLLEPTKLAPEFATYAKNCRFDRYALAPQKGVAHIAPAPVDFSATHGTLVYYRGEYYSHPDGTVFSRSPLINDYDDTYFLSHPTFAPVHGKRDDYPSTDRLGVPYPNEPAGVTVTNREYAGSIVYDVDQRKVFFDTADPHGLHTGQKIQIPGLFSDGSAVSPLLSQTQQTVVVVNATRVVLSEASAGFKEWVQIYNSGLYAEYWGKLQPFFTTPESITDSHGKTLHTFADTYLNPLVFSIGDEGWGYEPLLHANTAFRSMKADFAYDYDWNRKSTHDVSALDWGLLTAVNTEVGNAYQAIGGDALFTSATPVTTTPLTASLYGDELTKVTTHFVYTYVNEFGHESAPSLPSEAVDVTNSQLITLRVKAMPPGDWRWAGIIRIYQSASGSRTADFLFHSEVNFVNGGFGAPVGYMDTSFEFQMERPLQEALETIGWHPPPAGVVPDLEQDYQTGPLSGVVAMDTGYLAGFTGRTLCFSVPYAPYAWPVTYQQPVEYDIVGLQPIEGALIVLTRGKPYVAIGADPKSVVVRELGLFAPCASYYSIAAMDGFVIYASDNGLVAVDASGARVITNDVFSRDQWRALMPSSMRGCYVDGDYVAFGVGEDGPYGYRCYLKEEQVFTFFEPLALTPTLPALTSVSDEGRSVLAASDGVYQFGEGDELTFTWRSKVFDQDAPRNYSYAQIKGTGYPFTLRIITEAGGFHEYVVSTPEPIRLHSGILFRDWQFEVEGSGEIRSVALAQSPGELS